MGRTMDRRTFFCAISVFDCLICCFISLILVFALTRLLCHYSLV